MKRVLATPELIEWACKRSEIKRELLEAKFKKLPEWISGKLLPTETQLDNFAKTVHVPYGYLFLNEPPIENIPVVQFRTNDSIQVAKPSSELLDMIYTTQIRQSWYKEFAISENHPKCKLVKSATIDTLPAQQAKKIRKILNYDQFNKIKETKKIKPLKYLIDTIEEHGILVMVSGIVDSNTKRKLNTKEFRGFVICDSIAPLIFINGVDSESAKMFTLIHELAHLLLGSSDISEFGQKLDNKVEKWCNLFASEFLVPTSELQKKLTKNEEIETSIAMYSKHFNVSKLTILERLRDINSITPSVFDKLWKTELEIRERDRQKFKRGGGNFINTTLRRVGKKFAVAVITSTLESQTLYRDAFKMLGISKTETFNKLAQSVGVKK